MPQAFTTVVGRLRRSVEELGEVAEAGRGGVRDRPAELKYLIKRKCYHLAY